MPWKRRRGGRRYFYESRREGGRVRSIYVGSGRMAELTGGLLADRREARETDRLMAHARREAEASAERDFDDLFDLARELADWAMHRAGFHRPNRGPWRRRRRPMSETTPQAARPASPPVEPMELRRMMEVALLNRAVATATGERKDQAAREAARAYRADLLAFAGELAGPAPSPIVRALAFTAAVAYFDWVHAGFQSRGVQRERALERAERRFQRAARTLHAVQKHLPDSFLALQINVESRAAEGVTAPGPERVALRVSASGRGAMERAQD